MAHRPLLGLLLLLAGVAVFVLTWRSIAWMVYGGARDFVQLGLLALGLAAALRGGYMLCFPATGPAHTTDR